MKFKTIKQIKFQKNISSCFKVLSRQNNFKSWFRDIINYVLIFLGKKGDKILKKTIVFVIILSMLCTLNISAVSLKTPKLQFFTTGATEFGNTTVSISNGIGLATEHDPKNKNAEFGWHTRVILIDYEKGTKKILPYDGARNQEFDGDAADDNGFVEGWALVYRAGAIKNPYDDRGLGYTFINTEGKALTEPKFSYASSFRNGLAGVRYFEGNQCYTGVLQKNGKVKFAIGGQYSIHVGNDYVEFSGQKEKFCYDFNGKRLYLTDTEKRERDCKNYNAKERESFYKNYEKLYKSVEYCGSNRFYAETDKGRKVVDSQNKTIIPESYMVNGKIMNGNQIYFTTFKKGLCNKDGKVILAKKQEWIIPVDGGYFLGIIDNKIQTLIDSNGKVIATSNFDPIFVLSGTRVKTLYNANFDYEWRTKGTAYLYTDIDLNKKSSTAQLKKMYANSIKSNGKMELGVLNSAKNIAKNSTQKNIEMFGVMSELSYMQK